MHCYLDATRILVSSTIFQNLHQYMPSNTSDETLPVGAQRCVCWSVLASAVVTVVVI